MGFLGFPFAGIDDREIVGAVREDVGSGVLFVFGRMITLSFLFRFIC
jgi:hypothetical protein